MQRVSNKNIANIKCSILTGKLISGAVKLTSSSDDDTPATGAITANHNTDIKY